MNDRTSLTSAVDRSNKNNNNDNYSRNILHLRISEQPPLYAFLEEWFEIALACDVANDLLISGEGENEDLSATAHHLTLRATLQPTVTNESIITKSFDDANEIFQLVTDPPILPQLNYTKPSGNRMVIKCKVISREERIRTATAPILPTDRAIKICVHFALHNTTSTSPNSTTLGAEQKILKHTTTRPIQLVNYKFALTHEDDDAKKMKVATTDEEDVWYKDEGGRDKSMVAHIVIVAGNNPSFLPLSQDVPFHTILLYANAGGNVTTIDEGGNQREDVVRNQDILRVFGPAKHYIDAGKGRETVLYRIEEVSKSHQGNMFQLEIRSPADGRRDIAPVRTRPVSVRSKRNKRQRLSSTGIDTNSGVTTAPPVKATATATSTTTPKERDAAESFTNISPTITNPSTEGVTAILAPSIPAAAAAITPVSSMRQSIPARSTAVSTASLPVVNPYTMTSNNFQHRQVSSSTTSNGSYRHYNSNITYPTSTVQIESLLEMKEALNRIHNWVDVVVNNLKSIQWKVIGYDHNPDGSVNFNQPYYNMPNPNSCIANILAMFSNTTRDDILLIRSSLESSISRSMELTDVVSLRVSNDFSITDEQPSHNTTLGNNDSEVEAISNSTSTTAESSIMNSIQSATSHEATDAEQKSAIAFAAEGFDRGRSPPNVMYVLAMNYKVPRTGEPLGFPAFNAERVLIGFFRIEGTNQGNNPSFNEIFFPISWFAQDFGQAELDQATRILNVSIESHIDALYILTDYNNSLHRLLQDCSRFASVGCGTSNQPSGV